MVNLINEDNNWYLTNMRGKSNLLYFFKDDEATYE